MCIGRVCTGSGRERGMFETWMAGVAGVGAERPAGATDLSGSCGPYLTTHSTNVS